MASNAENVSIWWRHHVLISQSPRGSNYLWVNIGSYNGRLGTEQVNVWTLSLQCRHNGHDGVSNHQPLHCLLNRLFRHRSKKASKLRVTGLCVGNSPVTGEFPAQMARSAGNVSIWWRHHVLISQRPRSSNDLWVNIGSDNGRLGTEQVNAWTLSLQRRHNGSDGVSNHQPFHCLLNRLFRRRWKKNIKAPRHWPLCGEFTGDFPAQMASSAGNVFIWWRHHDDLVHWCICYEFSCLPCGLIQYKLQWFYLDRVTNSNAHVNVIFSIITILSSLLLLLWLLLLMFLYFCYCQWYYYHRRYRHCCVCIYVCVALAVRCQYSQTYIWNENNGSQNWRSDIGSSQIFLTSGATSNLDQNKTGRFWNTHNKEHLDGHNWQLRSPSFLFWFLDCHRENQLS